MRQLRPWLLCEESIPIQLQRFSVLNDGLYLLPLLTWVQGSCAAVWNCSSLLLTNNYTQPPLRPPLLWLLRVQGIDLPAAALAARELAGMCTLKHLRLGLRHVGGPGSCMRRSKCGSQVRTGSLKCGPAPGLRTGPGLWVHARATTLPISRHALWTVAAEMLGGKQVPPQQHPGHHTGQGKSRTLGPRMPVLGGCSALAAHSFEPLCQNTAVEYGHAQQKAGCCSALATLI